MRLSLLARKLSVKPSAIIQELLVEGEKPLHGNSKLTELQIAEVVKIFGPIPEELEEPAPVLQSVENEHTADDSAEEKEFSTNSGKETLPLADQEAQEAMDEVTGPIHEVTDEISQTPELSLEELEAAQFDDLTLSEATLPDEAQPLPSNAEVAPAKPEEVTEELTPAVTLENEQIIENDEQISDKEAENVGNAEKVEVLVSELLEDPDEALLENPDVLIKAPKVNLPGLTVKGKIELPEPKAKPEKESPDSDEEDEDHRGKRGKYKGKKRRQTNPVAAARMREERQAARKKKAMQAQEKERKRQHYEQNVQSKAAPPPKKKPSKKPDPIEQTRSAQEPEKKLNALQRFWKWMNT